MTELWEAVFIDKKTVWGLEPTRSAVLARDRFVRSDAKDVLIPGVGYGRNAKPFLESGMSVTGIEISGTAIALARSQLGLDFPIHHGSVSNMPFDDRQYDGMMPTRWGASSAPMDWSNSPCSTSRCTTAARSRSLT